MAVRLDVSDITRPAARASVRLLTQSEGSISVIFQHSQVAAVRLGLRDGQVSGHRLHTGSRQVHQFPPTEQNHYSQLMWTDDLSAVCYNLQPTQKLKERVKG